MNKNIKLMLVGMGVMLSGACGYGMKKDDFSSREVMSEIKNVNEWKNFLQDKKPAYYRLYSYGFNYDGRHFGNITVGCRNNNNTEADSHLHHKLCQTKFALNLGKTKNWGIQILDPDAIVVAEASIFEKPCHEDIAKLLTCRPKAGIVRIVSNLYVYSKKEDLLLETHTADSQKCLIAKYFDLDGTEFRGCSREDFIQNAVPKTSN